MLTLKIINIGGTNEQASYRYFVEVNGRQIASDRLTGHNRADGWEALVQAIALQEKEKGEASNEKDILKPL